MQIRAPMRPTSMQASQSANSCEVARSRSRARRACRGCHFRSRRPLAACAWRPVYLHEHKQTSEQTNQLCFISFRFLVRVDLVPISFMAIVVVVDAVGQPEVAGRRFDISISTLTCPTQSTRTSQLVISYQIKSDQTISHRIRSDLIE